MRYNMTYMCRIKPSSTLAPYKIRITKKRDAIVGPVTIDNCCKLLKQIRK